MALIGLVQELHRGEQVLGFASWDGDGETEVGALEVVPSQPAQQFEVAVGEVIEEEQVVRDELALHSSARSECNMFLALVRELYSPVFVRG